jgi:hypothetical protein
MFFGDFHNIESNLTDGTSLAYPNLLGTKAPSCLGQKAKLLLLLLYI